MSTKTMFCTITDTSKNDSVKQNQIVVWFANYQDSHVQYKSHDVCVK